MSCTNDDERWMVFFPDWTSFFVNMNFDEKHQIKPHQPPHWSIPRRSFKRWLLFELFQNKKKTDSSMQHLRYHEPQTIIGSQVFLFKYLVSSGKSFLNSQLSHVHHHLIRFNLIYCQTWNEWTLLWAQNSLLKYSSMFSRRFIFRGPSKLCQIEDWSARHNHMMRWQWNNELFQQTMNGCFFPSIFGFVNCIPSDWWQQTKKNKYFKQQILEDDDFDEVLFFPAIPTTIITNVIIFVNNFAFHYRGNAIFF